MPERRDDEWPSFEDLFLSAVMDRLRARGNDLWLRGRLFIEGDGGHDSAESIVVTLELRPHRSVIMHCERGAFATLRVRGTGRSDYGRTLLTTGRSRVEGGVAKLVQGYEDVVSQVLRSPKSGFAEAVEDVWRRACTR